jgi:hypothetical protein
VDLGPSTLQAAGLSGSQVRLISGGYRANVGSVERCFRRAALRTRPFFGWSASSPAAHLLDRLGQIVDLAAQIVQGGDDGGILGRLDRQLALVLPGLLL